MSSARIQALASVELLKKECKALREDSVLISQEVKSTAYYANEMITFLISELHSAIDESSNINISTENIHTLLTGLSGKLADTFATTARSISEAQETSLNYDDCMFKLKHARLMYDVAIHKYIKTIREDN